MAFWLCWGSTDIALSFLSQTAFQQCGGAPWCNCGAELELWLLKLRAGFLWVLTDLQVQTRLFLLRADLKKFVCRQQ